MRIRTVDRDGNPTYRKLRNTDKDWKNWSDEQVDRFALSILEYAADKGEVETLLQKGSSGPNSDFRKIIKQRKDLPEAIQMLLGRYGDPVINIEKTLLKQARLRTAMQTVADMKSVGLGSIFFADPETAPPDAVPIVVSDQRLPLEMQQLDGYFTYPEVRRALVKSFSPSSMNAVFRSLAAFNSAVRRGKTVYSPDTAMRNLYGNSPFAIMNGHAGLTPGLGQRRIVVKGLTELANGLGIVNRKGEGEQARFDYLNHMRELGLLDQDIELQEIQRLMQDSGLSKKIRQLKNMPVGKQAAAIDRLMTRFYASGDAVWKLGAFQIEMERYNSVYGYQKGSPEYQALE